MSRGRPSADVTPVLLITGPVGVGKSTTALEMSSQLQQASIPHAVIDLDALSWCFPAPFEDPYNTRVALRNLESVWANYRAAGAHRLVLVRVIESRSELASYRRVLPGVDITIVRLRASLETLRNRVTNRELGSDRTASLERAIELADLMDEQAVEDYLVETDGRTVTEVARQILRQADWLRVSPRVRQGA